MAKNTKKALVFCNGVIIFDSNDSKKFLIVDLSRIRNSQLLCESDKKYSNAIVLHVLQSSHTLLTSDRVCNRRRHRYLHRFVETLPYFFKSCTFKAMTVRSEDIAQLTAMGFPETDARNALLETGGNLEMAVNGLLSGNTFGGGSAAGGPSTSSQRATSSNNDANSLVRGSTSQYTYGSDGRSACTCIALTAADLVLNAATTTSPVLTTAFLDRAIQDGVARYTILRSALASSGSSSVEHLSADEVLQKDDANNNTRIFDIQLNHTGVRQGALSRDAEHPLGMKYVLRGLVDDIRIERNQRKSTDGTNDDRSPMICLLLTKSPETVLLCLPNVDEQEQDSTNESPTNKYWLVDSHPRPQLFQGAEASYAKSHDTFDTLLESLRNLFPFMDLGPDVPPMMADMYNMFDLYALERRKE